VKAIDWLFRNRQTGEITIAQFPNPPLWVFIGAFGIGALLHPTGTFATVVEVVGRVALLVWALDEVVRGVNPWRRILGTTVLLWQLASAVT